MIMAKRKETQAPEEEVLNEVQKAEANAEEQNIGIRCEATPENDGVAIIDEEGQTLLIVALNESQLAFGGDESQDLEEDIPSPSMTGLDGEQRSAFLIDFYRSQEKNVPALDACAEYGWLPSGGEMALIHANKATINEVLEALGGTVLSDGRYWTSQRFSNDRMWSCDMADGTFGIALGTASVAYVRAVKK